MKRRATDDEPSRRDLTADEWKNVKERLASWGRDADDDWKTFKENFARIGINVADSVKVDLFGPLLIPLARDLTDDEWKEIKKCLARTSVNADHVEVQLFGKRWPLREAVPTFFRYSDVSEPKYVGATPHDLAKKQTIAIDHCNDLMQELCDLVNSLSEADMLSKESPDQLFQFPELTSRAWAAQQHLHTLVPELERCRDKLIAMGTGKGEHLRKTHVEFWRQLTRVWRDNVDKDIKHRNKHLANFLRACSEPFCPEETQGGAIEAFVERYAASSK